MNKEELINKFFEKLLQYADGAEKFTQDQAPKYVEELLAYGVLESTTSFYLYGFLCLVSLIVMFFLFLKALFDDSSMGGHGISGFTMMIICIGFGGSSYFYYLKLKKIELAPRVYIVEELRK